MSDISLDSVLLNAQKEVAPSQEMDLAQVLEKAGESLGQFKAYDSQLPLAEIAGTRIVKCLYQAPKDKSKAKKENSYVRISTAHLSEKLIVSHLAELTPHILAWLQEQEALEIKELHKKGQLNVYPASLSMDAIIERLEEANEGSRLNKDKIESWFTDVLADNLAVLFADKLALNENSSEQELAKLEMIVNAYKAKFASLSSPKCYLKEEDCKAMLSVMAKCDAGESNMIGKRLQAKLEKMMQPKEEELLMSL